MSHRKPHSLVPVAVRGSRIRSPSGSQLNVPTPKGRLCGERRWEPSISLPLLDMCVNL